MVLQVALEMAPMRMFRDLGRGRQSNPGNFETCLLLVMVSKGGTIPMLVCWCPGRLDQGPVKMLESWLGRGVGSSMLGTSVRSEWAELQASTPSHQKTRIGKTCMRNPCAPEHRHWIAQVTECVEERTTEGVCFRSKMNSGGLPYTRPLYLQISRGLRAKCLEEGSKKTFLGQAATAAMWETWLVSINHRK